MAQVSFSITKRCAFRDSTQEFSNVYTYQVPVVPNSTEANDRIDELVTIEKTYHSTDVTFLLGRCWTSGGSVASNQMISERTLSGAGSTTPNANLDRERAVLIQWPAGFDSRGHPVKLKKWYHTCGAFGSVAFGATLLANTTAFTAGNRTTMAGLADGVRLIGTANEYALSSAAGRLTTGAAEAHAYLEHHQLGDQWRG